MKRVRPRKLTLLEYMSMPSDKRPTCYFGTQPITGVRKDPKHTGRYVVDAGGQSFAYRVDSESVYYFTHEDTMATVPDQALIDKITALTELLSKPRYSVAVQLINPKDGTPTTFTITGTDMNHIAGEMVAVKTNLFSKGFTVAATPEPPATVGHAADASPGTTEQDTVRCTMIRVQTSQTGNKPQLVFTCDDIKEPIKATVKPNDTFQDLLKFIPKIRTSKGQPFTAADMVANRSDTGEWLLTYKVSDDGKYKNLKTIVDAP